MVGVWLSQWFVPDTEFCIQKHLFVELYGKISKELFLNLWTRKYKMYIFTFVNGCTDPYKNLS